MNLTAERCNVTDELSVRACALTGPGTGREAPRKEGRKNGAGLCAVTPCLAQLLLKGDRKEYMERNFFS